jgi:hypothetical protein
MLVLAQDCPNLGSVFVEQRRRRHLRCALTVELKRRSYRIPATFPERRHRHDQAEVLRLRVFHDRIDAIDRSKRDVVLAQSLRPLAQRAGQ